MDGTTGGWNQSKPLLRHIERHYVLLPQIIPVHSSADADTVPVHGDGDVGLRDKTPPCVGSQSENLESGRPIEGRPINFPGPQDFVGVVTRFESEGAMRTGLYPFREIHCRLRKDHALFSAQVADLGLGVVLADESVYTLGEP